MPETQNLQTDILILGAGGAGLPAAVQAFESGAKSVIILEKRNTTGGNAVFANGIFACESPVQRSSQVFMGKDELFNAAMAWHHYDRIDARILRAYIDKCGDTIAWLMSKGIQFKVGSEMMMYPGQTPSWHIAMNKETGDLSRFTQVFRKLLNECKEHGGTVLMKADTKKLLKDEVGHICGAEVLIEGKSTTIHAKTIILACGGFIGNKKILHEYFPYYDDNFGGFYIKMMGDGIKLAAEAGAALEPYSTLVKEAPASSDEMKERAIGMVCREPDIVWVNQLGERFANETIGAHLQTSANAILHQPNKVAYTIFDHKTIDFIKQNGWTLPKYPSEDWHIKFADQLASASEKGIWAKTSDTIEGLAEFIGAAPSVLKASIEEYNAACACGHDAIFAKDRRFLKPLIEPPFYAVKFGVLIIETVGPVRVNEKMQVLNDKYQPIQGLFAAGAMAAGWQGHDYCGDLMFGSALGFAMSSGRIAGEQAVAYTKLNT